MTTASNLKPLPKSVTQSLAWRWYNSRLGTWLTMYSWDIGRAWRRFRFFFDHVCDCDSCGYPSPVARMVQGRYGLECRSCAQMGAMIRAAHRRYPDAFAIRDSRTPDQSTTIEATQ